MYAIAYTSGGSGPNVPLQTPRSSLVSGFAVAAVIVSTSTLTCFACGPLMRNAMVPSVAGRASRSVTAAGDGACAPGPVNDREPQGRNARTARQAAARRVGRWLRRFGDWAKPSTARL